MGHQTYTDLELTNILEPLVPGGVQWFPGHMAKARREIGERLKLVNAVVEVVDARIPHSSRHPALGEMVGERTHVIALTKIDLADAACTRQWVRQMRQPGLSVFPVDAAHGRGIADILAALRQRRPPIRVLVLGVPNSGKSSLINRACGRAGSRVGASPGITRGPQWLKADSGIEFLDTPGLLWPKIAHLLQGLKLVWVGSVGDNAYNAQAVGGALAVWLAYMQPEVLSARYGVTLGDAAPAPDTLLTEIGRRRGCLMAGGSVNLEQAARILLQDFRTGKLGRITLDTPTNTNADS